MVRRGLRLDSVRRCTLRPTPVRVIQAAQRRIGGGRAGVQRPPGEAVRRRADEGFRATLHNRHGASATPTPSPGSAAAAASAAVAATVAAAVAANARNSTADGGDGDGDGEGDRSGDGSGDGCTTAEMGAPQRRWLRASISGRRDGRQWHKRDGHSHKAAAAHTNPSPRQPGTSQAGQAVAPAGRHRRPYDCAPHDGAVGPEARHVTWLSVATVAGEAGRGCKTGVGSGRVA